MAKLRGAPMPVVKCVTNDLLVPADAECVLEGYLSPEGHVEDEGPYGEFLGYYGGVKRNPVFHLTAITRRKDALFQTTSIAGRHMSCTDTAQLVALKAELGLWGALATAVRRSGRRLRDYIQRRMLPCASRSQSALARRCAQCHRRRYWAVS